MNKSLHNLTSKDSPFVAQIKRQFIAWAQEQEVVGENFFSRHDGSDAESLISLLSESISVELIQQDDGRLTIYIDCDGRALGKTRGFYEEANAVLDFRDLANGFVEHLAAQIRVAHPHAAVETESRDYGYAKHLENEELSSYPAERICEDDSGDPYVFVGDMEEMDEMIPIGNSAITAPPELLAGMMRSAHTGLAHLPIKPSGLMTEGRH